MSDLDSLLGQYDEEARANWEASQGPPRERPDEAFRGTFLPFRETVDGRQEWAAPKVVQGPIDAARTMAHGIYNAPAWGPMARPSQMPRHVSDQMVEHGMDVAGTAITGGAPAVAMSGMPRNQLSAFMTPDQMGRLQGAGRIAPGARGSQEALAGAKEQWAKGNLDTWKDYGWAHESAFGPEGVKPIAWHDTRDFRLKPRIQEAFDKSYHPGTTTGMLATKEGKTLPEVFEGRGVDDILAAEPSLSGVPVRIGLRRGYPEGGTHPRLNASGHVSGAPYRIEAFGDAQPNAMETMVHELMGHAVPTTDGALRISQYAMSGTPVPGTPAEATLRRMTDEMRKKLISARLSGDMETWSTLRDVVGALDEMAYRAPERAGYFAAPHERMAREAMMRHYDPSLDMVSPGKIDVYEGRAWPGGEKQMAVSNEYGIPLRDYAPPGSPFARKD